MKKMRVSFVLLLCFICMLSGCTHRSSTNNKVKKVVAASRSIADMWLLAGGELAGTTDDAMDLEGITNETKMIGTNTKINLETIAALEPDLVLLSGAIPTHKTVASTLSDMGMTCEAVNVNNFDDYALKMKDFTEMTGRDDLYQSAVTDVKTHIDAILQKELDTTAKTYLTIRISSSKTSAMTDEFFVCQMLNDFSLTNASVSHNSHASLGLEAVLDLDPDYIFIVTQGDETKSQQLYKNAYASQKAWQGLKAVKNNHVQILPKDMFEYKPNAKWDKAYDYLYQILKNE